MQTVTWIRWIMLLAFAFVVIFLPVRSQKKREQELQTKVAALQKGDQIILANGIIGTVVGFKDDALEVKISEGIKLTVLKNAVVGFLNDRTQSADKGGKK